MDTEEFKQFINIHNSIVLPVFRLQESLKHNFNYYFWSEGIKIKNSLSKSEHTYIWIKYQKS
jgi:hypothetical protein